MGRLGALVGILLVGGIASAEAQCADGSVEVRFSPNVAGCAGAWNEPGLVGADGPVAPNCDRASGNTGRLTTAEAMEVEGKFCTAADLCAPGWGLCDLFAFESGDRCGDGVPEGEVYVAAVDACVIEGLPRVIGCGTLGCEPPPDSGPICTAADRLSGPGAAGGDLCGNLDQEGCNVGALAGGGWRCANAGEGPNAVESVTKSTSMAGGVLCCSEEACDCLDPDGGCVEAGEAVETCLVCPPGGGELVVPPRCQDAGAPEVDAATPEPDAAAPDARPADPEEEIGFRGAGGCQCRAGAGDGFATLGPLLALLALRRRR